MKARIKWVDFKAIKGKVGIVDVLKHYGLVEEMKERKNGELVGYCPIHDENRYNKNSFCVNTKKSNFHCFACGAGGNVLDFVAQMEDVDIRQAGLLIQQWFNLAPKKKLAKERQKPEVEPEKTATISETPGSEQEPANPPLTFELKNLVQNHPYLKERGLKEETITEFGIGFCNRGLMKGRIAIPIHNENGQLVAYAGRWPGEPPEGEPKYILPPKFQKHLILYNFDKAKKLAKEHGLILVEGFFDVMKLWQAGFRNVMALMGTSLSAEQEQLLIEVLTPSGKLTLMLDPDESGRKAAKEIVKRLITQVYVKVIDLSDAGSEPDEMSEEKIKALLR